MTRTRNTLAGQLRRAILATGVRRSAISLASGVGEATLSRFMRGTVDIQLTTLDALARVLRLRLVQDKARPKIPQRPLGRPRKKGKVRR